MKVIHKTDTIHFTVKGQVVIPSWLRKEFDIEAGTRALVYQDGDAIVLKPITRQHIKSLRGSLKGSGVLKSLMDDRKRERNSDVAVKVLDSWALIAFFEDEPAAEQVENLLVKAESSAHKLLLSVVNWGEIYYNTMREVSQEASERQAKEIAGLPIEIVGIDADNLELARQAAIYKATRKLSYADAFAAALAKIRRAELVTGDREFKLVESEIKIDWLK